MSSLLDAIALGKTNKMLIEKSVEKELSEEVRWPIVCATIRECHKACYNEIASGNHEPSIAIAVYRIQFESDAFRKASTGLLPSDSCFLKQIEQLAAELGMVVDEPDKYGVSFILPEYAEYLKEATPIDKKWAALSTIITTAVNDASVLQQTRSSVSEWPTKMYDVLKRKNDAIRARDEVGKRYDALKEKYGV